MSEGRYVRIVMDAVALALWTWLIWLGPRLVAKPPDVLVSAAVAFAVVWALRCSTWRDTREWL